MARRADEDDSGGVEKVRVEGKAVPVNQWWVSGVREILHRDLDRGVVTFGKVRRTGPKTRVVMPAYGPRYDDFCQLMLHLLAEAAGAREPSQRESLFGLCTERRPAPAIAGGSDAQVGDQTGRVSSGPPM